MIYLDNASTTKPCDKTKYAVCEMMENFGNPSSLHRLGMNAEKVIKNAKKAVSGLAGCDSEDVYFTSGATESSNTVIFGVKNMSRKQHFITTQIEHPSVLEPFRKLEANGAMVDYISVDKDGIINLSELEEKLCDDTALVSVMYVNNETGSIQPIEEIGKLAKARGALFHVDAVQGFGKLPLNMKKCGINFLSASAHKIHGVKGVGALCTDKTRLVPYILGGAQQKNMRSGTENTVGIAGFTAACEYAEKIDIERIYALRKMLYDSILEKIPNVKYNGSSDKFSPYILNMSFLGVKSEILLHSLEAEEIYVSTGSACSTNKPAPSHVLQAMGCDKAEISGAIRFSLSDEITEADIVKTVDVLEREVANIRKYSR